jgi:2-polyprenyl-3-methyl-5-hydroxy-6-metoxy-1,4-benzoquinol methylase
MKSPDDAAAKVYDIVYDDYTNKEETKKELNFIRSQIKTNGSILDLGCGTGRHTIPLIKMGYTLCGVDNSKEMLKVLKTKLKKDNLKAEIINKSINEKINFNQAFEGIICFWNAFTQMAVTKKEATNIFNLLFKSLKKNGKIIIDVGNPEAFDLHNNTFKSSLIKNGKTYETTFEPIEVDDKKNITKSNETIVIKQNGKIIEEMKSQFVQRWWKKDELEKMCKDTGFSKIKFYGEDYKNFKETSKKILLVAVK